MQDFFNNRNSSITRFLSTYNLNSTTLLFKMPSSIPSAAQNAFADIFHTWRQKQKGYLVTFMGYVRGNSQGKIADLTFRPYDVPIHRDTKWPTVAVEVKWSEGRGKVQRGMKFWLKDSRGDVKVALTVSVQRRGKITVERWDLSPGGNPFPYQTVDIHRGAEGPLINGEINVKFRDVFLRDKEPTESDFTLTHDDMQHMAWNVWLALDERYS
jgi:hypothetical protein